MSYERICVTRVTKQKAEDGSERVYVEFTQQIEARFRIDKHMDLKPVYDSLLGREVLVSLRAGVFEGRPYWSLDKAELPIPVLPLDSFQPEQAQASQPVPAASAVRSPMAAIAGAVGK